MHTSASPNGVRMTGGDGQGGDNERVNEGAGRRSRSEVSQPAKGNQTDKMQTRLLAQKLKLQACQPFTRVVNISESDNGNFKIECIRCQLHLTVTSKVGMEKVHKEHAYLSCPRIALESKPTTSQQAWNRCLLCNGDKKPTFKNMADLKMHMLYAHCNVFFSVKVPNYQEPYRCPYCIGEAQLLESWGETLDHLGVHHEKLYQALKHHRTQDLRNLLKRLYPSKHKRHMEAARQRRSL